MEEQERIAIRLTDMWQRLLDRPVGTGDDFFDLGGDSMKAIKLVMEIQSVFAIDLDVETFFEKPCIDNLTKIIARSEAAAHDAPR